MTTPALTQVLSALETLLAGLSGVTVATTDPGGAVSYPAVALAIGGQERREELGGQTDWILTVEVGMAVQEDAHGDLNGAVAELFAKIGEAVEADRTLSGAVWDAKVVGMDPVELLPDGAGRKPLAVSAALVEVSYAQPEGDYRTLK